MLEAHGEATGLKDGGDSFADVRGLLGGEPVPGHRPESGTVVGDSYRPRDRAAGERREYWHIACGPRLSGVPSDCVRRRQAECDAGALVEDAVGEAVPESERRPVKLGVQSSGMHG